MGSQPKTWAPMPSPSLAEMTYTAVAKPPAAQAIDEMSEIRRRVFRSARNRFQVKRSGGAESGEDEVGGPAVATGVEVELLRMEFNLSPPLAFVAGRLKAC